LLLMAKKKEGPSGVVIGTIAVMDPLRVFAVDREYIFSFLV
jgi:hypothetical protein